MRVGWFGVNLVLVTQDPPEAYLFQAVSHHRPTASVPCLVCGAVEACAECGGCRADMRDPVSAGAFDFNHAPCDPYCGLCGKPYLLEVYDDDDSWRCDGCGEDIDECVCL